MQQKKIKLVLFALFHCVSSLADHVIVVLHAAIPHGFSSVRSLTHTIRTPDRTTHSSGGLQLLRKETEENTS